MLEDSQVIFLQSVEAKRCMICLTLVKTSQFIDMAPAGDQQVGSKIMM